MSGMEAKGRYYPWPVAADVEGEHGPETVTRYAVVTPEGDLLHKLIGGPRLFRSLNGARSHAWRLNNPTR